MTILATSIFAGENQSLDAALDEAKRAIEGGARLIEWRVDTLVDEPASARSLRRLLDETPAPSILTCRPHWEGGHYDGDDDTRIELLIASLDGAGAPKYIDVEWKLFERAPETAQRLLDAIARANEDPGTDVGLILSAHDDAQRPTDLLQRIEAMTNADAGSVIKIAWRARSLRDNLQAFELLRERKKPTIALCMGEFGLMSRVLAPKFGGFLTFATPGTGNESAGHETAPGQPTIDELRNIYRFDSIGPATKVYGVIGWPVAHSLGPKLHNAGFEAVGHDGVYLPLPIPSEYEHFNATVGALLDDEHLDFRGASVTIPHKENLLRFVRERGGIVEPMAQRIGAANTLTVHDDGSIEVSNSDCPAAIKTLCARMDIEFEALADKTVAMLGAGGVARGITAGLVQFGADVTIFNRSPERAEALAVSFSDIGSVGVGESGQLLEERFDIYINATPMGMAGGDAADDSPLPAGAPLDGAVVMDTVYTPVETPLLKQAEAAGAITLDGLAMFVHQAGAQFKQWTGHALPVDVVNVS